MTQNFGKNHKQKQLLVFTLLGEQLGLDVSCVREVLRPQKIHSLPKSPDFIEGIINVRGHIIAVIDLRKKFHLEAEEDTPDKRIVVCKIRRFIVGVKVDSIIEVLNIVEEDIETTPEVVSMQIESDYMSGIARLGERVIVLLNLEKVLTREETNKLTQMKK